MHHTCDRCTGAMPDYGGGQLRLIVPNGEVLSYDLCGHCVRRMDDYLGARNAEFLPPAGSVIDAVAATPPVAS